MVTIKVRQNGPYLVDGDDVTIVVPLSVRGDRLLDVIATAGGIKTAVHETTIQLTRDNRTASAPLQALLDDPRENVYARPGDVITVSRETRT